MFSEEFKAEIMEDIRNIIREEMEAAFGNKKLVKIKELPPFLKKDHLKELLYIRDTKASELLGRSDFPTLRQAGVLVPTHLFFKWVEHNTEWIDLNSDSPKDAKSLRVI